MGVAPVASDYVSRQCWAADPESARENPGADDSLRTFHLPAREAVNLATVAISKNSRNPGKLRNFRDSVQPFGNAQQDAQVLGLFSLVYRLQLWSIRGTIHLENDDCWINQRPLRVVGRTREISRI